MGSVCGVSGRELERGRGERDWSERRECVRGEKMGRVEELEGKVGNGKEE